MPAIGLLQPVDRSDVRVVEGGKDFRLALEPSQPLRVLGELIGQDFDRDIPAELCVSCPIDFTHPAFADGLQDLVVGESLAGCE